jgi:hypothetical protein
VGTDTPTFKEALRNCVRQDPDVIMVGEMRDLETMSTAITAAETGHLVFSTLHTNNAAQTIDRIIDSYPVGPAAPGAQPARSGDAGDRLDAAGQQRKDGTARMPACEIMLNSPKISKHIEAGEIKEITEEMENSVSYYRMQSMNQSLISLLAHNIITYEQAVEASAEPEDLSLKLRKMFPSIEERFREGEMAPSPADFSEITGLLETKKLYEEAEEVHRSKIAERDGIIADLEREVAELRDSGRPGHRRLRRAAPRGRDGPRPRSPASARNPRPRSTPSTNGSAISTRSSRATARASSSAERWRVQRDARCEMRDAGCGMRDSGCGIRDARCGMRDSGCGIRDARCGMRDARFAMRDSRCETRDPQSEVCERTIGLPGGVSDLFGVAEVEPLLEHDAEIDEGEHLVFTLDALGDHHRMRSTRETGDGAIRDCCLMGWLGRPRTSI